MSVTAQQSNGRTAIRPVTIATPESELEDLRARIAATRWPEKETVADQSQGVALATMQAVAVREGRMYQLVRQHDAVRERTLEIMFLESGAEAYAFTFGS